MKSVFKFPIQTTDEQTIAMPAGATILCVQTQRDAPQLWALVDTVQPTASRRIRIVGTGHHADDVGAYVGTYQLASGSLVFHVFDQGEVTP